MKIAILGATSQIARDLVQSAESEGHEWYLYARRPEVVTQWLSANRIANVALAASYARFGAAQYDAIINFVGAGDPAKIRALGASIFDITLQYDQLAIDYLRQHESCRYLFLSSGAAYGDVFDEQPVGLFSAAAIPINDFQPRSWYGMAKLHAECRHRAMSELPIVDIRIFSYFSRTVSIEAQFLLSEMIRCIRKKTVLAAEPGEVFRDYLHPVDFRNMVGAVLLSAAGNASIDCFSKAPVAKSELLDAFQLEFGLRHEISGRGPTLDATGQKRFYYSLNRLASEFGYAPTRTSLEGILEETQAVMASWRSER